MITGCGNSSGESLLAGLATGGIVGADVGAVVSLVTTGRRWRPLSPSGWQAAVVGGPGRLSIGLSRALLRR